jgi:hypothetical protein
VAIVAGVAGLLAIGLLGKSLIAHITWMVLFVLAWLMVATFLGPQVPPIYEHGGSVLTSEGVYYAGGDVAIDAYCWEFGPCIRVDYLYETIVFKCGYLGIACQAIYHGEEQLYDDPPVITFRSESGTIGFIIEGDVVWEHSVASGGN